jgi:uncharacterized membrane protein YbhN (UPF0104 family)
MRYAVAIARVLGLVVAVLLVARVAAGVDLARAGAVLREVGWLLPLGLMPYVAAIGLDTVGWRLLLGALGRRPALASLLRVRFASEAVNLSLPMGALAAEAVKTCLVGRLGVPAADTVVSLAGKKALVTLALAAVLATSAAVGWAHLAFASRALLGTGGLPLAVLAAAAIVAVAALTLGRALGRFAVATSLRADRRAQLAALAVFTCGWIVELLESWLLLRVAGAELSLAQVFALEAAAILIRNLAVVAPAGLGFQDAGYLAFLGAFGVPAEIAGSFLVLKRSRELVCVAAGYLLLATTGYGRARARRPAPVRTAAMAARSRRERTMSTARPGCTMRSSSISSSSGLPSMRMRSMRK